MPLPFATRSSPAATTTTRLDRGAERSTELNPVLGQCQGGSRPAATRCLDQVDKICSAFGQRFRGQAGWRAAQSPHLLDDKALMGWELIGRPLYEAGKRRHGGANAGDAVRRNAAVPQGAVQDVLEIGWPGSRKSSLMSVMGCVSVQIKRNLG